jgi:MGT family glycosyltransferase
MARILIATVPFAGHINPFIPIARALRARGHELRWYTGAKYRERVAAAASEVIGYAHAPDFDDAQIGEVFPTRAALRGIAQLKFDMKHVFIDGATGQLRDLQAIVRDFAPDVLFIDPGMVGGLFHYELTGLPTVVLGVLPLLIGSVDVAPFGLGLPPDASMPGRLRNRALNWAVEHALFRDVQRHWNATRATVGLAPTGWWLDAAIKTATCLQPTIPSFEYPRRDLPAHVHFIGAMPAEVPSAWQAPDFWPELDHGRPVIHVTQGTVANQTPELIAPALAGLASEDVLVVVATGGRSAESLGLRDVPRNARIATFLSYPELMPKTAVMVTNGGYGGVQIALTHGVPLVVAGTTEDKPEVAARVAWSGAGLNLKTATPTPAQVRTGVRTLLDHPRYRDRAGVLAREYARHDAIARAVERIEAAVRPGG